MNYTPTKGDNILNSSSVFLWDGSASTATLKKVLKCTGGTEDVTITKNGTTWSGSYTDNGTTVTLNISGFTYDSSTKGITGTISRNHANNDGRPGGHEGSDDVNNDDTGSFTGTKT